MSSTPAVPAIPSVYQLRVVLHGISPLIWRRLLVPATATIAELHTILQTAFGWHGEHLHRLVIHGTEYGIAYVGGPGFRDNARTVRLDELGLRLGERFTYEYNFTAGWQADLRVEQIQPSAPARGYPRCVGGRWAGPPEDWGGPWAFVEQTQPHLVFTAIVRAAEIISQLLEADETPCSCSASSETSWPACCRCWAWSVSTAGRSTTPWRYCPRPRRGWHETHRARHAVR